MGRVDGGPFNIMEEIINILESHPLFKSVSVRALVQLTTNARITDYQPGDLIYTSGTASEYAYLVISGTCESQPIDNSQSATSYGIGTIFGERGIISSSLRKNTVTAVTEACLLAIDGQFFRSLLVRNEQLAAAFQGVQQKPTLYFDASSNTFKPCKKNLSVFVNFTDIPLEKEILTHISHTLNRETQKSVLLLHFKDDGTGLNIAEVTEKARLLYSQNRVPHDSQSLPFLKADINLRSAERTYASLLPFLETCSRHFPYIIAYLPGHSHTPTSIQCIKHADNVYLGIDQENLDVYAIQSLLRQANGHDRLKYKPLLCLHKGELLGDVPSLEAKLGLRIHTTIRTNSSDINIPSFPGDDLERNRRYHRQFGSIAREIGRCRRGLVLSSGAAKGLAHIGVIQVLEENGIEIDAISGSSIGSYVGACWARGYHGKALESLASNYKKPYGLWKLVDPVFPPRKGAIRGRKVERRLRKTLMGAQFQDLSIPLNVVVTNLNTLDQVVISSGDVTSAVSASCAIPGICTPKEREGKLYIDGGIANPLPIDALMNTGVEKIIAVSTILTPEHAQKCSIQRKSLGKPSLGKRILKHINKHVNYFSSGNVFDTLMRSIEAAQIRMLERDLLHAQVLIQPIACDGMWHNFTRPDRYISLGRKAAEQQLENILKAT